MRPKRKRLTADDIVKLARQTEVLHVLGVQEITRVVLPEARVMFDWYKLDGLLTTLPANWWDYEADYLAGEQAPYGVFEVAYSTLYLVSRGGKATRSEALEYNRAVYEGRVEEPLEADPVMRSYIEQEYADAVAAGDREATARLELLRRARWRAVPMWLIRFAETPETAIQLVTLRVRVSWLAAFRLLTSGDVMVPCTFEKVESPTASLALEIERMLEESRERATTEGPDED